MYSHKETILQFIFLVLKISIKLGAMAEHGIHSSVWDNFEHHSEKQNASRLLLTGDLLTGMQ